MQEVLYQAACEPYFMTRTIELVRVLITDLIKFRPNVTTMKVTKLDFGQFTLGLPPYRSIFLFRFLFQV